MQWCWSTAQLMRRRNKILIWIGAIILLLFGVYFLALPSIVGSVFSTEPRNPKLQIPETANIGWWAYQDALTVDTFQVELIESKLNLFNSKSLIRYTVKGQLSYKGHWKPSIKDIHVSQMFLRQYDKELHPYLDSDTAQTPEALISVTPVIKVMNDEDYNGEELDFEFTNEIRLESFHWGNCRVRFQCSDKWKDLVLEQRK